MQSNPSEIMDRCTRNLCHDFTLQPLVKDNVPVFLAVAWPTHEGATGRKPRLPAGRGLSSQQAMISTAAEALELRASLAQNHIDEADVLPRKDGFAQVTGWDLWTGELVAVPAQEVWLDAAAVLGEPLFCDADSTGCAVGRNRGEAIQSALWECIERDALALWWHGGLQPRELRGEDYDILQPRLYWWLERRKRLTRLLDLTTDVGLPVVAAVSSGQGGKEVALGSAARPQVADAALAAVTEMIQTEVSMDLARQAGDPEVEEWDAFASTTHLGQFHPVPGMRPASPSDLIGRLADLGLAAQAFDLTLPGDPMPSMRVLVPGLCAMRGRIDTPRFRRLCPSNPPPSFPEPY